MHPLSVRPPERAAARQVKRIIVDTGPLVALLNARDTHHAWARATFDDIEPPAWTCEAVISEACLLVRQVKDGADAVLPWSLAA